MKTLKYILIAIFSTLIFTACDEEAPEDYKEQLVVDGFLYVGNPLSIKLSHTVRFEDAYYADSVRVTGAEVCITVDGVTYALTEANSGIPGMYSAPADSHIVQTGKTYYLMIMNSGYPDVHAQTTATENLILGDAHLVSRDDPTIIRETNPDTVEYGSDLLQLTWNEDPNVFGYALLIENLDSYKYGYDCDVGADNGPGSYVSLWSFRFADHLEIGDVNYCYEGQYQVRVYSCETDAWTYFNTTVPDNFENRPVTNLNSGLGVFCAVGCDTFAFALTDTLED